MPSVAEVRESSDLVLIRPVDPRPGRHLLRTSAVVRAALRRARAARRALFEDAHRRTCLRPVEAARSMPMSCSTG